MNISMTNTTTAPALPRQTPQQAWSGRTFRALLSALSQPGTRIEPTPSPGFLPIAVPSVCRLPLALASRGTPIAMPGLDEATARIIAMAIGANLTDQTDADLIAFVRRPRPGELLEIARGSATQPERGASAAIGVGGIRRLAPDGSAAADNERRLRISGPGVDGNATVAVDEGATDLGTVLQDRSTACSRQPAGIDLWFFDHAGHVLGVPRSSTITWEH